MFIPSRRSLGAKSGRFPTPTQKDVELLKEEVHDLTTQTDRYRDQTSLSAALTTTAGLVAAAGGALSLLSVTESVGMGIAGVAGAALIGGIGLCLHTNSKFKGSEKERLAVAGELFETRRAVGQEKVRNLFQSA